MGLLFSRELHFLTSLYAETFFNKVLFVFCIQKKFALCCSAASLPELLLAVGIAAGMAVLPERHLNCCFSTGMLHAACSGIACASLHPPFFTNLKVKSLFLIFFIIYNQQVI